MASLAPDDLNTLLTRKATAEALNATGYPVRPATLATKTSRAVVRELARVIRLLSQDGVTILLIEQNLKLAEEVADRLAVMVKGRIVYSATPAAFRAEEVSIRTRYLTV